MKLNILLFEEKSSYGSVLQESIRNINFFEKNITEVSSVDKCYEELKSNNFDIILLSSSQDENKVSETLDNLVKKVFKIPIIVIGSSCLTEFKQKYIIRGVQDFICKENITSQILEDSILCSIERNKISLRLNEELKCSKIKETVLKHKNKILNVLLNNTDTVKIFLVDSEYKYLAFNQNHKAEVKKIYGTDITIGMNILDAISIPEVKPIVKEILDRVLGGESFCDIQQQLNTDIYYEFHWNTIRIDGKIIGVSCFVIDISKRKKAELDLEKNEKKYKTLFNTMTQGVVYQDSKGNIVDANKAAERILGLTLNQMLGLESTDERWRSIHEDGTPFPGEEHPSMMALRTGKEINNILMGIYNFYDDKYRWININAVPTFNENEVAPNSVYTTFEDITERISADANIRKLSKAIEQSPVSVVITNTSGVFEYANKKFFDLTGYEPEEIKGLKPNILKSGKQDNSFYKNLWDTIKSGEQWEGEMLNKKKNGELYWESELISPIYNNNGEIINFVAVKEDITEKKKRINDLILLKELAEQSSKLKDAFIANISHEIRTPLTGIVGLASVIKEIFSEQLSEEEKKLFFGITESSKRLTRTVDLILDYSRIQTGDYPFRLTEVNLSSLCSILVHKYSALAEKKSIDLTFEDMCDNPVIFADEKTIILAVSNIIDNSIKFSNKGIITLLLAYGENGKIILTIKDNGIGIGEDYLSHIFEPFRQEAIGFGRAYEGIGLGLPIVKKIMDLNKATIDIKSEKGKGTIVSLIFNGIDGTIEKESFIDLRSIIPAKKIAAGREILILAIEDDDLCQLTIQSMLGNNYKVLFAESSCTAYEILKNHKVDLILMDVSIKGDRNGLELAKELKASKEYGTIIIVALTAHTLQQDRQNAANAGCDDFIPKPYTTELLNEKIRNLIKLKG